MSLRKHDEGTPFIQRGSPGRKIPLAIGQSMGRPLVSSFTGKPFSSDAGPSSLPPPTSNYNKPPLQTSTFKEVYGRFRYSAPESENDQSGGGSDDEGDELDELSSTNRNSFDIENPLVKVKSSCLEASLDWANETTFRKLVYRPFILGLQYGKDHYIAACFSIIAALPLGIFAFHSDPKTLIDYLVSMSVSEGISSSFFSISSFIMNIAFAADFAPSAIHKLLYELSHFGESPIMNILCLTGGFAVLIAAFGVGYSSYLFLPEILAALGTAAEIVGYVIAALLGGSSAFLSFATRYLGLLDVSKVLIDAFNPDIRIRNQAVQRLNTLKKDLMEEINTFLFSNDAILAALDSTAKKEAEKQTIIKLMDHMSLFDYFLGEIKTFLAEGDYDQLLQKMQAWAEEDSEYKPMADFFLSNFFPAAVDPSDEIKSQHLQRIKEISENGSIFNTPSTFDTFKKYAGPIGKILFGLTGAVLVHQIFAQKAVEGLNVILKFTFKTIFSTTIDLQQLPLFFLQLIGFLPGAISSLFYALHMSKAPGVFAKTYEEIKKSPAYLFHLIPLFIFAIASGSSMRNMSHGIFNKDNNILPFSLTDTLKEVLAYFIGACGAIVNWKVIFALWNGSGGKTELANLEEVALMEYQKNIAALESKRIDPVVAAKLRGHHFFSPAPPKNGEERATSRADFSQPFAGTALY